MNIKEFGSHMMISCRRLVPILIVSTLISGMVKSPATASQIDNKMQRIVEQLLRAASQKEIETDRIILAVFPFQAEENLVKKRVHFAVGEILTHHLVKEGTFRLVERNELQKIFDEQKLGQTGVVESETAAKVGQILGARLAALGTVIRVGKSYQISVKLVDTHTSEIIGAAIEEVPIKMFDQEAAPYLVLVPQHQAIGLYFQSDFAPSVHVEDVPPSTFHDLILTPTNKPPLFFPPHTVGLGIRYSPWSRWMFDLYIALQADFDNDKEDLFTVTADGSTSQTERRSDFKTMLKGRGARLTLNHVIRVTSHINGYIGAGFEIYGLEYVEHTLGQYRIGDQIYVIEVDTNYEKHSFSLIRLGLEWRLQARFGLALFGNFYPKKDTAHIIAELTKESGEMTETDTATVYKLRTPWFTSGLSISFYF
jgi:TolB-like protein